MSLGFSTLIVGALVSMLMPVDAIYLNDVGSDTMEFRTASCGAPALSLVGVDPEMNAGSETLIGAETSGPACEAASSKRMLGALVLLVAGASGGDWRIAGDGLRQRQGNPFRPATLSAA